MRIITLLITFIVGTIFQAVADPSPVERDPFWPVGYAPAKPEPEKPIEKPKEIEKKPEPPPPPKPITENDWKMARKLLKITGYALADRQVGDGSVKTSIVIINNQHYQSGDTLKISSNGIDFVWKIGKIENNAVDLIQTSAQRMEGAKPSDKPKLPAVKKPLAPLEVIR